MAGARRTGAVGANLATGEQRTGWQIGLIFCKRLATSLRSTLISAIPSALSMESALVVCVCNAIRESQVRDAARAGSMTPARCIKPWVVSPNAVSARSSHGPSSRRNGPPRKRPSPLPMRPTASPCVQGLWENGDGRRSQSSSRPAPNGRNGGGLHDRRRAARPVTASAMSICGVRTWRPSTFWSARSPTIPGADGSMGCSSWVQDLPSPRSWPRQPASTSNTAKLPRMGTVTALNGISAGRLPWPRPSMAANNRLPIAAAPFRPARHRPTGASRHHPHCNVAPAR